MGQNPVSPLNSGFLFNGYSLHNSVRACGETMEVKTVAIRVQMPDTLRAKFKAQCALQGKTMNEMVIELIEGWLAESSNSTP